MIAPVVRRVLLGRPVPNGAAPSDPTNVLARSRVGSPTPEHYDRAISAAIGAAASAPGSTSRPSPMAAAS